MYDLEMGRRDLLRNLLAVLLGLPLLFGRLTGRTSPKRIGSGDRLAG
jgi:hypothetical protein